MLAHICGPLIHLSSFGERRRCRRARMTAQKSRPSTPDLDPSMLARCVHVCVGGFLHNNNNSKRRQITGAHRSRRCRTPQPENDLRPPCLGATTVMMGWRMPREGGGGRLDPHSEAVLFSKQEGAGEGEGEEKVAGGTVIPSNTNSNKELL